MSPDLSPSETNETDLFETIENVLGALNWQFERDGYDSVQCVAPTRWGEMGCLLTYRGHPPALHISLTLDVKPMSRRRSGISELILLMNERLWLGHFDYWVEDEIIIFRHSLPLSGRLTASEGEIEAVLTAAKEAVDKFVPAFNFVVWAGKSPSEAIAASMFETEGEA